MGQRHQLFVIAKINGRYRNLCVIHHQWLYGHTALRRCLDALNIFSNATNRMPIQQELISAAAHDEEFWGTCSDAIPFPFILSCLVTGASFNVEGYYYGILVEDFQTAYNQGDNNNGITIFDISDLDNVRYCFVDYHGMESEREVSLMTPLSARTYLEAYYELDDPKCEEMGLLPLLDKFKGRSIITGAALQDTWPEGDWQMDECDPQPQAINLDDNADNQPTKSLRDQSMDTFLGMVISQTEENPDLMAEAQMMHDFSSRLREQLYDRAANMERSAYLLDLLYMALQHDKVVDLSPFKTLTIEDLSLLVTRLCGNGKMKGLCLSNMPGLTESDLELILAKLSPPSVGAGSECALSPRAAGRGQNLMAMILLEDPQISIDFLTKNLGQYEIYHSEIFRIPLRNMCADAEESIQELEYAAPNIISQLVWVGVSSRQSCDSKLRLDNGQIDWSGIKYSFDAASPFHTGPSIKYKNFLLDVPLSAGKTVRSLQRLLQYLTFSKRNSFEDWPKAAARCFATTSPTFDKDECSVGPLSVRLSYNDHVMSFGPRKPLGPNRKGRLPPSGSWAIILVHEAFDARNQEELDLVHESKSQEENRESQTEVSARNFKPLKRVRYALAKMLPAEAATENRFMATDILGYLENVMGGTEEEISEVRELNAWWHKKSETLGNDNNYHGDEDIYDILRKVYPSEPPTEEMEEPLGSVDPVDHIMRMITTIATERDS
ncbi:hypothetical protein ACLMJK_002217 [Lecanora helva]